MVIFFFFFFFQAEDGIRDATVTVVQTCALPICLLHGGPPPSTSACLAYVSRQRAVRLAVAALSWMSTLEATAVKRILRLSAPSAISRGPSSARPPLPSDARRSRRARDLRIRPAETRAHALCPCGKAL